jgi:hypothetical protein
MMPTIPMPPLATIIVPSFRPGKPTPDPGPGRLSHLPLGGAIPCQGERAPHPVRHFRRSDRGSRCHTSTAELRLPKPETAQVVYQQKHSFLLVRANIRSHRGTVWFGRVPLVLLLRCYLGEVDERRGVEEVTARPVTSPSPGQGYPVTRVPSSTAWLPRFLDQVLTTIAASCASFLIRSRATAESTILT